MKIFSIKIFSSALLINIFLFSSLALISYQEDIRGKELNEEKKIESFFPIEEVIIEEEKVEEEQEPVNLKPEVKINETKKLDLSMDLPELDFMINPEIKTAFALNVKAPSINDLYELSDLDKAPLPKFRRDPVYPFRARRLNIEGEVVLKFVVTSKGNVKNVRVIKSTPKGVFERSAIQCVSSWKFSPGELSGTNVNTVFVLPLKYKLKT